MVRYGHIQQAVGQTKIETRRGRCVQLRTSKSLIGLDFLTHLIESGSGHKTWRFWMFGPKLCRSDSSIYCVTDRRRPRPSGPCRRGEGGRGARGGREERRRAPLLPGFPVQIANRYNIMCLSRVERSERARQRRGGIRGREEGWGEHNDDEDRDGAERERGEDVLHIKRRRKRCPGRSTRSTMADWRRGGDGLTYLATKYM